MPYTVFFISAAILAGAAVFVLLPARLRRRTLRLSPLHAALICVFLAGVLLHIPLYAQTWAGDTALESFQAALHHTLRLFVLDGELDPIYQFSQGLEGWLATGYFLLAAAVYLLGPLLTFSTVLSFFKNFSAFWQFNLHLFSETFFFSELNARSLCLAESLKDAHPRALIAFADVYESEDEDRDDQLLAARRLGAACFRKDITEVSLALHRRTNEITFFLIGSDEEENLRQGIELVGAYGGEERMSLYLFASGIESELLFQKAPAGMKVRRINDVRALTDRVLYEEGGALFQSAAALPDGEKRISAVLLGLGDYGTEMLRGLSWYGQMEGYRLELTAFDRRPDALDRFTALCPELMSPAFNGAETGGEARYRITIHAGVDVETASCLRLLEEMEDITYVFVALGGDTENIAAAVKIREVCQRLGRKPCIYAVVFDGGKAEALRGAVNFRDVPYDIRPVGDLRSFYTEKNLLDSQLEQAALKRHCRWGEEEAFWRFDFNYRSSVASAIHSAAKLACGIPGAEKPPEQRTAEEKERLRLIEHRRWNAYMRSEGYRYSGSRDRASRDDLAKLHNDLVPYGVLSEKDREKDDV